MTAKKSTTKKEEPQVTEFDDEAIDLDDAIAQFGGPVDIEALYNDSDSIEESPSFAAYDESIANQYLSVHANLDGYVLRWINDSGNKIYSSRHQGWEFVTQEEAKRIGTRHVTDNNTSLGTSTVSAYVGRDRNSGDAIKAYLMKRREDLDKKLYKKKQEAATRALPEDYKREYNIRQLQG